MEHNIQHLDNEAPLQKAQALVKKEGKITFFVLHHLREISKRRLFASRGFSSIFEYVTQELGYSDAAAARRLAAMTLLSEIPSVEEKINQLVKSKENSCNDLLNPFKSKDQTKLNQ